MLTFKWHVLPRCSDRMCLNMAWLSHAQLIPDYHFTLYRLNLTLTAGKAKLHFAYGTGKVHVATVRLSCKVKNKVLVEVFWNSKWDLYNYVIAIIDKMY